MEQRRGKSGHLRKIQKDPESTCNKQEVEQNPKNPLETICKEQNKFQSMKRFSRGDGNDWAT